MKIAVTSNGSSLDDAVDPRFGRCSHFLIVDTETMAFEAVDNPNIALGGGAGIQSAQLVAERGVQAVLTGNCGPNSHQTLAAAGISVVVGASGRVREAVERYKAGSLPAVEGPNVASHFGGGTAGAPSASGGLPYPQGPGAGMGMGRGMRGGRGMGRGSGRGMGMGRGGGRGMSGSAGWPGSAQSAPLGRGGAPPVGDGTRSPFPSGSSGDIGSLKSQAAQLEAQLRAVHERIGEMEKGGAAKRLVAVVDANACLACGICEEVCPTGAIMIDTIAVIDAEACTGCNRCVEACPRGALSLQST